MSTTENLVQKLPSNQKIEKGIENVRQEIHAVRTAPGLDTTGHRILTDTEQVLSSAETLLREKNEGDKLQRIIKEGQKATAELQQQAKELRSTGAPSIDTERLRELAERTMETARLAGIELISSNSFRRTLGDFLLLCYDIIADTTTDTAHKVGKKKKGTKLETTPSQKTTEASAAAPSPFSLSTPSTTMPSGQPSSVAPSTTTAGPAKMSYASAVGGGGRAGETSIGGAAPTSTSTTTTTSTTGGESLKDQAKEGLETAINKGLSAAGTDQRVRLSKEQIDELVNRFIDLMRNIGQRERTKNVFIGLMDMFKLFGQQVTEGYTATGDSVMNKAERSAAAVRYNKHVMRTLTLSRELFEQFAGEKSMDTLIYHLRKVDKAVRKDKDTRAYFRELRSYVTDILNRPELIDDAETGRKGRRLIKRGRRLHDKKLWVHLRGILDESKNILHNIQADPTARALKNDMKRLIQDIMLDEKGNVVLKENVLNQLRLILVSSVIERMRMPMPTIRMEDETMAYTIKNLVVSIRDLVPERVVIENRGRLSLDLGDVRSPGVEEASNTIRLVIENINIHMEQADIKFHRKTFPKVTDKGKLRMDIGGRGMDLVLQLQTFAGSRDVFRVQFVDCDVHNLDFYLQDTRHDWLYNSVLKLLSGRIKRGMESNIENTLRNHLEGLNRMLLKQIRKSKGLTKKGGLLEGGGAPSLTSVLKSGANVLTGGTNILS